MRNVTVNGVGSLALVEAVWRRAWFDLCLGPGKTAANERIRKELRQAGREFLLDPGALSFLMELGIEPDVVRRLTLETIDVGERQRREVMWLYDSGFRMGEIVRRVYGGSSNMRYYHMLGVLIEEVGNDY